MSETINESGKVSFKFVLSALAVILSIIPVMILLSVYTNHNALNVPAYYFVVFVSIYIFKNKEIVLRTILKTSLIIFKIIYSIAIVVTMVKLHVVISFVMIFAWYFVYLCTDDDYGCSY